MALVKRSDGTFLINQSPLQWGTIRQARGLFRVDLQRALDMAAEFRAANVEVFASSDSGTETDPAYVAPTKDVDLSVSWPSSWRIQIDRLGETRFIHSLLDSQNVQHSIIGKNPQEVVSKLAESLDFNAQEYVKAITPEPEVAVVPVAQEISEAPRKIVRPGDRSWSLQDIEELAAQRAAREAPKVTPAEIEFMNFYNSAQTVHIKTRMEKDPEFYGWAVRSGLVINTEASNARNS